MSNITKLTVLGQILLHGKSSLPITCPDCCQTRGLTLATRDGEQAVTGLCPGGHRWLEEAITGDDVREWNAAIEREKNAQNGVRS